MAAARDNTLVLQTTQGPVTIEMRPDLAPNHVSRIKELVRERFYDGVVFHRVIDGFMAQTGCPHGTGTGGSGKKLKAEFTREPHVRGTVSMARAANPDSADSQFFICFDDASFLNGQYTVWGNVIEGIENVDRIKRGEPVVDPDRIEHAWIAADISLGAVRSDEQRQHDSQSLPEEPSTEAGPTFAVRVGKIDLVPSVETDNSWDQSTQAALHQQILRQVAQLQAETLKIGNQYPNLAQTIDEYAKLVRQPLTDLDIVALWSVGSCLLAYAYSFEHHDQHRTMTEPLEPVHLSLLTGVSRLHGGFILGFPKGIALTERADRAQFAPNVVQSIGEPTSRILDALSHQRDLVSERARHFLALLNSTVLASGWETARVGYVCYAAVRNCLIALGKALIWFNDKGGSVVGGVMLASGLSAAGITAESVELAASFLHARASEILSFAAPFPELRAWICWIIDEFDKAHVENRRLN